jgi:hypothetical protein
MSKRPEFPLERQRDTKRAKKTPQERGDIFLQGSDLRHPVFGGGYLDPTTKLDASPKCGPLI